MSGHEAQWGVEELFFSRTDLRGVIESGNSVFVRVSGYSAEDLLGKPHNVIRHPDMPKTVFSLLWEYIKSGKPIVAYVKNKSKDGSYYWVLALVMPIDENYVSIRLKPTTQTLHVISQLYGKLREIERSQPIAAGTAFLKESLKELGFEDYDSLSLLHEKKLNLPSMRVILFWEP